MTTERSRSRNVNAYVKRVRRARRLGARYDRVHARCERIAGPLADARREAQVAYLRLNGAQIAEAERLLAGPSPK